VKNATTEENFELQTLHTKQQELRISVTNEALRLYAEKTGNLAIYHEAMSEAVAKFVNEFPKKVGKPYGDIVRAIESRQAQ
jgi:hypothetical protein